MTAQPSHPIPEKIAEMARRIVEQIRPDKIVLFGSYARGTAGPDSDVDLLVILPVRDSKRKIAVQIYALLAGSGLPKDIVVATPEEIERYRDIPGTLIRPALLEGQTLYERAA